MAGYLGAIPVPQATQHRESFTATSGQTTFNTAGYTVGFLDVYLNGSHLSPADFTATNGSDVVLASGASTGDVCDIISYTAFEVADQTFTGTTTMTGAVNMASTLQVDGAITSSAGATITTADNSDTLSLVSTDADANVGPNLNLYRNSSSPADNDIAGKIQFNSRNDNSQNVIYSEMYITTPDVSDGSEDGQLHIDTMVAGTSRSRVKLMPTETVFNENSIDLDFRVESNGNANMLFVDGGNDAVGIGTGSPTQLLTVGNTSTQFTRMQFYAATNGASTIHFGDGTSGADNYQGYLNYAHDSNSMQFATSSTERMRIDSSGNLLVGKTSVDTTTDGLVMRERGQVYATSDGNTPVILNRKTSDGDIVQVRKDNTTVGSIASRGGEFLAIGSGDTMLEYNFGSDQINPSSGSAARDNAIDLGSSGARFDDIFATNGTIQTSDRNEKQDIAILTSAEMLVGKRISALFKTFRWKDKVAAKGANARTHTGVIAQDVQAAFIAEGLDAGDYALFTSATWWETQTDVPAVEADEDNDIEAKEAYTRTDTYETLEEAPEGATERTRMGIRYPELLSFVAAYNEQRFASIETRLTALEGE